jgi:HlyD family secretion protein
MEKKTLFLIICLVILIPAGLSGCGDQGTEADLPTGYVEAQEVDVNTKLPGRVVELLVKEGDPVEAVQVLAKLDDKDLKAKENQVLATMEAAKAQLQKARTGRRVTEETVKAARERAGAALDRAEAEAQLAAKTLERMERLFEQGAIPQQQLDEARAKARAAEAAKNEARAAVAEAEAARLKITLAGDEVEAARAQYQQAQATLEEVRNNLAELEMEAPRAGTVTAVNVEEGELVSTGLPVITITDFDRNWVEMQVNQDIVQGLQLRQEVTVLAGEKSYPGEISMIGSKPSFATRRATTERGDKDIVTYEVHVSVNNPELRPGMNVEVKFNNSTGGAEDAA